MSHKRWQKLLSVVMVLSFLLSFASPGAVGASAPQIQPASRPLAVIPTSWCIAGGFQGWNNNQDHLYDDATHGDLFAGDGVFSADLTVAAAGRYEFKVVECGNWGLAYPADNSWVVTSAANQVVKFTFDANNHSADAGTLLLPAQNIVSAWDDDPARTYNAVGDFQGWNNNDPAWKLTRQGSGLFSLSKTIAVPGTYSGKVVSSGTWDGFGADGRDKNAANLSFTTTVADQLVVFLLDVRAGRVVIKPNGAIFATWCAAGGFQTPNAWIPGADPLKDDGTQGDLLGGDGIFSKDFTIATPGRYEWKVTNCSWNTTYPGQNSWFVTSTPNQVVKLTFDTNDHSADAGLKLVPAASIVNVIGDTLPASFTAVGSFQSSSFNYADPATLMTNAGMGLYTLQLPVAAVGNYIGKITTTGGWDAFGADGRSKDAANLDIQVAYSGDVVQFVLDTFRGRMAIVAPPKLTHSQDNVVDVPGLLHDSRDSIYRQPFGAVVPNTSVKLRLRTFHNDVTSVKVRFYDGATSTEFYRFMDLATTNITCFDPAKAKETCDYWELTYVPDHPTNLYYRFIVKDGTDTVYYADTDQKLGGLGAATAAMVDNSYVVTVYDPAFQPVPWMQNAVIYQIFPDRFANGSQANDPKPSDFRYGFPSEPLDQIIKKAWYELPEGYCRGYAGPATPCTESPRGRDYFGGDLAGLRLKLPYLKALGITVIYLNPVFESGSNHGYDTRDYYSISQFFGTNQEFTDLAAEAHAQGMRIILDGVFNHLSSDSPFFDRYHHYSQVGACESLTSVYRDWFTFHDVAAGSGTCVGTAGANSATYDSWFGFDSIPVLNKNNPAVKNMVYAASDSIARTWLEMGADGWRLDVMNDGSFPADFWPSFRAAVQDTKSDAVVIGELWKKADVLPMITGNMADTTMNYRFRNAILGFFGKVDNKGFADDGQSNQPPSLFASKLLSVREDYPDATYYTLMNLMDSHDTERILWTLTPGNANREDKEFNPANVAMGKRLLRLAVVVQMTTPGAPTIFYGDELGLTGSDDPDDRRPFPWQNLVFLPVLSNPNPIVGLPFQPEASTNYFYAGGDHAQLDYYRKLITFRTSHPVVSSGKLTFLLADDPNRTLAYIMRSEEDAALVAINRSPDPKTLTIDLKGMLPSAAVLDDALGGIPRVFAVNGVATVTLPGLSAAVLIPDKRAGLMAPGTASALNAVAGSGQVTLSWAAASAAARYNIYRSPIQGGGFAKIGSSATTGYLDAAVTNGQRYYYVVKAVKANGIEGAASPEAWAVPAFPIGWANLLKPPTITVTIQVAPTPNIYGQIWIGGFTDAGGDPAAILAQVGFGAQGSSPAGWTTWKAMAFDSKVGNNFQYIGTLRPEAVGVYSYQVRYSDNGGLTWVYADLNGIGTANPGVLTVNPSADVTPPAAPANLRVVDWSPEMISLAWDSVADGAEYWVYRRAAGEIYDPGPIAKISAPAVTFVDTTVFAGIAYTYKVIALDSSLNKSPASNEVTQVAEPKMVNVTFRVRVPAETPPGDVVYIAGDGFAQQWNPSAYPMTNKGGEIWETTFTFKDGLTLQFKFARGSWERVEWWGTIVSTANRSMSVSYGTDGNQLLDLTATDWGTGADSTKAVRYWRDPLVTGTVYSAVDGTLAVDFAQPIQPLAGSSDFAASVAVTKGGSPVSGAVTAPTTSRLVWTPAAPLTSGAYTVTVSSLRSNLGGDSVNIQAPYVFTLNVP